MSESFVVAAHRILFSSTPDAVRAEAATRHAEVECLASICDRSPLPENSAALRSALDAAWPYTHAVGMLKASGL